MPLLRKSGNMKGSENLRTVEIKEYHFQNVLKELAIYTMYVT